MATINLISGPRNISTALMYSFAQRSDTCVFDEPFYAVYLLASGADHPGREAVIENLPNTEAEVWEMIKHEAERPVVFIKNMAHHIEVLHAPWIDDAINVFLIRNPRQIIASYAEVIQTPGMRDIGIEFQYELFQASQYNGNQPIVLDTGNLLENPKVVLTKLCNACGIKFEQRMLHWPKGAKPYDGVWATHWYGNVHNSSGFNRPNNSAIRPLPEHLAALYKDAMIFYEKLLPFSLKA